MLEKRRLCQALSKTPRQSGPTRECRSRRFCKLLDLPETDLAPPASPSPRQTARERPGHPLKPARGRRRNTAATTSTRLRAMARPGPRCAEPENLAVDGTADHGCNGLPLRADCQRQRPEPVKQNMPGFAAPPTGPNKVGKLASANTRHRRQDSASRRRCRPPLKARVPGIDRRKRTGTTQSQGSSSPRPGAWSTDCGW